MPFSLFQRAVRILCIALSIETCLSSPVANTTVLRPVHTAEYYRSFGIQPRDPNQFSKLELQTQGELIYGGSQGIYAATPKYNMKRQTKQYSVDNGDLIVANMTLYAPDGLLMVLLEHFDHLTSAIDCEGDDGILSLTFNSHQSYEYALQAWGFVNANADGKFLLIANHKGCGPDDERQAYMCAQHPESEETQVTRL